ncbi:MAG TPA: glycolate oxidase subunit GlcE [Burkholderiaceae bacterium]|jgi:glycolate oxidase FAD binding subunit|nr:glycolate oxidase subunit GlcE [Burkholderiaceae bacterium]
MEKVLQEFKERIAAATANGNALRIVGGGTKDWYGNRLQGETLSTLAYSGIADYEPTELVITARCGTPLAEIEAALAEQNQMFAFEPPHFGAGATIGGVVASGLSGPRRAAVGAVRDFVLGAVLMDGKGEVLHFGGQVMKNVAGYDVSRLMTGAMGTLGLLLEVSIKVLPRPPVETTLRFQLDQADAIRRLNEWGGQPLPISASVWQDGALLLRLSGATAAVAAAKNKLGGEELGACADTWADLREQRSAYFKTQDDPLWRLSLPSTAQPLALPGEQLIEWGGAQRWLKTNASASDIRTAAAQAGGHATLFRGGDKQVGVFHPLTKTQAMLHRNLKAAFDPARIFNPGRLYADM